MRDAFLERPATGDLDLSVDGASARPFSEALAKALGTRAIPLGAPPKSVWRVPWKRREVDVWERERNASAEADRDRRDFTVNALSFEIPGGLFDAPPSALADLARGTLRAPRRGVLLKDPLRALRAARFEAELGFRPHRSSLPELEEAARRLHLTAPERRLVELDRLLSADSAGAARGLVRLETLGALERLIGDSTRAQRRLGIRRAVRTEHRDPALRRVLLLSPLGAQRVDEVLAAWRAPSRDRRLAAKLLAVPTASAKPDARAIAACLRALDPFVSQGVEFLSAVGGKHASRLARAISAAAGSPARLRRILAPRRPLTTDEIAVLTGLGPSPAFGRALAELDLALAAGEVRGREAARRFLLGLRALTRPDAGATVVSQSTSGARTQWT